jgi:LemA protein
VCENGRILEKWLEQEFIVLTTSVLGWLLLGVLVFWEVGAYNRLVRLRSAALLAFGALDAQWLRHVELLSAAMPLPVAGESVEPLAEPEPFCTTALSAASAQLMASLSVARSRPLERDAIAALAAARSVWDMAWAQALGQGDVDRSAEQQRWDLWATQAEAAQSQFNNAITQHNLAVNQFPAVVLARIFGFRPAGSL